MNNKNNDFIPTTSDFLRLSSRLLNLANRKLLRLDFLREISNLLINFSNCDALEVHVKENSRCYLCLISKSNVNRFSFEVVDGKLDNASKESRSILNLSEIKHICHKIISDEVNSAFGSSTRYGSYLLNNLKKYKIRTVDNIHSIFIIPIRFDGEIIGLLLLKSEQYDAFPEEIISLYEDIAKIIGTAINQRRIQVALRERVKELTCLYSIAKIAAQQNLNMEVMLQKIIELLPPGWLYPEIAQGRIVCGNKSYCTPGYTETDFRLSADIIVNNRKYGTVEVVYSEERSELDEGPFLKEERSLLNAIARELGIIIERRIAQKEKQRLEEQLEHADRLATIGQLAAGVAHELNEPLGSILGFAQLSQKCPEIPNLVASDLKKIENASLHAREIIRKLLVFARQTSSKKLPLVLNDVVKDCIELLAGRLAKENIKLTLALLLDMPKILADRSQLNQVLVNLIVNSMQAMPNGGILSISTSIEGNNAYLIVEDTGIGIEDVIIDQIFLPFFTTKGENQGTGLGLAVVHGIVTAHNGNIKVKSEVGKGTKFEIRLPIENGI